MRAIDCGELTDSVALYVNDNDAYWRLFNGGRCKVCVQSVIRRISDPVLITVLCAFLVLVFVLEKSETTTKLYSL